MLLCSYCLLTRVSDVLVLSLVQVCGLNYYYYYYYVR